jgi:membrane protease YdiL (CAAX protease family)
LCISVIVALAVGQVQPIALIWIFGSGLCLWATNRAKLSRRARWAAGFGFCIVALLMANHALPGFNNLRVFDHVRFSPESAPFTMYLNFDKTALGLLTYLLFVTTIDSKLLRKSDVVLSIRVFCILLAVMLPLALAVHYVKFDPKFPAGSWLWILNNLFFVCVAEECLFRGFVQGGLERFQLGSPFQHLPLIAGSVLFGLYHYEGGLTYIAFATIAGAFYGFAYRSTKRIESAIIVHFGLNLTHFLFFSYPSLG